MSKTNLFDQPGVEKLIPGRELPVAVKVTGRNLHAVGLLVSVSAETLSSRTALSAAFEADGSLDHVDLIGTAGEATVKAGDYLLLSDDRSSLIVADKRGYEYAKSAVRLVAAVDKAAETLFGRL